MAADVCLLTLRPRARAGPADVVLEKDGLRVSVGVRARCGGVVARGGGGAARFLAFELAVPARAPSRRPGAAAGVLRMEDGVVGRLNRKSDCECEASLG